MFPEEWRYFPIKAFFPFMMVTFNDLLACHVEHE